MSLIHPDRVSKRDQRLVIVLDRHVLMSLQCVCIREGRVELDRALEAPNGDVVFLLERVAVADGAPSLRRASVERDELMREIGECYILAQVPQEGGVVLGVL